MNNRLKSIAWVTANYSGGGAEAVVAELHNCALQQGLNSTWIVLCRQERAPINVPQNIIFLNYTRTSFSLFGLIRAIFRVKPEQIVFNLMHVNIIGALISVIYKSRFVAVEHNIIQTKPGGYFTKPLLLRIIARIVYRGFDHIIAVSTGVKEDLIKFIKVKESIIKVVNNPIKNVEFKTNKPKTMGFIGSLTEQKGLNTLLKAYQIYKRNGGERDLVIAGTGHLCEQVQQKIVEYNLTNNIKMLGFVDDVQEFYNSIDILVVPSEWEGFCNVVGEGIFSGCFALVSDCHSGPADIVSKLNNAELFQPGDVHALYTLMMKYDYNSNKPMQITVAQRNSFTAEHVLEAYIRCSK